MYFWRGTHGPEGFFGRGARLAVGVTVATLVAAQSAWAFYLDEDRNLSFRMRAYAQYSMATEDSEIQTDPAKFTGQMMSQRNFFNPEFDAKLTPYLQKWFGSSFLDDLSVRGAAWGFYDGLYDYGPEAYADRLRQEKFHYDAQGKPYPHGAYQTQGYSKQQAIEGRGSRRDIRDIYGRRIRANEAYVNIAKGPLFLRIGRQAISWGESDTIALLDANNPFDSTITPGIFWDVDESRIPLWTVRGTYQLFSNIGPFSSGFLDAYLVPGMIDTEVGYLQVSSASPYSYPPPAGGVTSEVFDQLPQEKFGNSRWGVRFQTVIARNYTTSVWFYKTFQTAPVPLLLGVSKDTGRVVTAMQHRLTNVAGIATTFFLEPLNSIMRAEVEVFNNEPAFRVNTNITPAFTAECGLQGKNCSRFDKINIVRGEVGLDRNIFIRMLNPTTSFTWINAVVFAWNPDETKYKDYRASGLLKPSAIAREKNGGLPAGTLTTTCDGHSATGALKGCDFVNQSDFYVFLQEHMETDYMHGKLKPAVTMILDSNAALTFMPEVTYRATDSFLFNMKYVNIHTFGSENTGFSTSPGGLRDRDQVWLRATYQLN